MDNRAIGIFDSGLGGFTVVKEINKILPNESIVYFGDSGRTPYGTKSHNTIIRYVCQDANFLISKNIKILVIACNTASAHAYEILKDHLNIPVIEVVRPGAAEAVNKTKNHRIGVIGTTATIESCAYEKQIKMLLSSEKVFSKACPLFVPLAEEGQKWWDCDITMNIALKYLKEFVQNDIDTLVLGCTHYPLLNNVIKKAVGEKIVLVSSAFQVAKEVLRELTLNNIAAEEKHKRNECYYTSDSIDKFGKLSSIILGKQLMNVEQIRIDSYPDFF